MQDKAILTDDVVQYASDQLKTFLFAGYDTSSIVTQWALYELARTPQVHKSLCAELDEVLGPDLGLASVKQKLLNSGDILQRLPYTLAVIKETLRVHPPASTARYCPPGSEFFVTDPADGKQYKLDGLLVYLMHNQMHVDEAVYGETVDEFIPERWLRGSMAREDSTIDDFENMQPDVGNQEASKASSASSAIPTTAWRPFERGPRNCIGQELAKITICAILAVAARRYDFTKVGLGELQLDEDGKPVLTEKGQYKVKSELYIVSTWLISLR